MAGAAGIGRGKNGEEETTVSERSLVSSTGGAAVSTSNSSCSSLAILSCSSISSSAIAGASPSAPLVRVDEDVAPI